MLHTSHISALPVCCLTVAGWLLDPDTDTSSVHFDKFVEKTLSISPFGGGEEAGAEALQGAERKILDETFCNVMFQDLALCARMWDLMVEVLIRRFPPHQLLFLFLPRSVGG